MSTKSILNWIALILLIIGGLNWGLVGLFQLNLVGAIFGGAVWLERLIYILVGVAAVYVLVTSPRLVREVPART